MAGAFQRDIDAQFLVRQLRRVLDRGDLDLVAVHDHEIAVHLHLAGKFAMHGIVAQQMRVGFDGAQIVYAHHHDVLTLGLHDRAQNQPPDAAEPVDRDAHCHVTFLLMLSAHPCAAFATASAVMPKCL